MTRVALGEAGECRAPCYIVTMRASLKQRLSALFAEYGRIAIIVYLVLSIGAIVGFSIAIGVGAEPSSATGVLGVLFAGWAAAKVTMPIRILATLGLTPLVAMVVLRRRRRTAPAPDAAPALAPPSEPSASAATASTDP